MSLRVCALVVISCLGGCIEQSARGPIRAATMGVIINTNDPDSIAAAADYMRLHGIPQSNAIRVALPVRDTLTMGEFTPLNDRLRARESDLAAFAIVWAKPFRVECMSLTSAIAFDGDMGGCASGCRTTRVNRWFFDPEGELTRTREHTPAMLVTAGDLEATRALMRRGALAEQESDDAAALLVVSGDRARDVRQPSFARLVSDPPARVRIERRAGFPNKADNVMFYFTGAVEVPGLDQIEFLPGAVADHLTSHGGNLYGTSQMSALAWIRAGATGSYGAVREPCNFVSKFPDPERFIRRYTAGDTLLQAYWTSVEMPGQGIFVGDPLARPYRVR